MASPAVHISHHHGRGRALGASLVAAAFLAAAADAPALINPKFTPVHLTDQSKLILALKLSLGEKDAIRVQLVECVKGEKTSTAPVIDTKDTLPEQIEEFVRLIKANGDGPVLLFTGEYKEEGPDEGGGEQTRIPDALLHLRYKWVSLMKEKGGVYHVNAIDGNMQKTWAGESSMLLNCVRYCMADSAPVVPCPATQGCAWDEAKRIATITGKVHGMTAVDLRGDLRSHVHILRDAGDLFYLYNPATKAMEDVTTALKIDAKSVAAAWGDFNGDVLFYLASWDGKNLTLWLQGKGTTFTKKAVDAEIKGAVIGLITLGFGEKGRPGLLVSIKDAPPVLLAPNDAGGFTASPLPGAKAELGTMYGCVVADFDNDGCPDIVQPCEKGMVFYKGKSAGTFDTPVASTGVSAGNVHAVACTGDFDHDELLDVLVAGDQGCCMWNNRGGGKFVETMGYSGEAAYISQPGENTPQVCDINNDGRQDFFLTYTSTSDPFSPHLFINRGFRSFGHAHTYDLKEKGLSLWTADEQTLRNEKRDKDKNYQDDRGQQAGLMHDLDGDGGQDMAFVSDGGEFWVAWRQVGDVHPLYVRAVVPPGGPAGPVRIVAWDQKRCLGAWNAMQGSPGAFFGKIEPGKIRLRWQYPGGQAKEKEVTVEDAPVRFVLEP